MKATAAFLFTISLVGCMTPRDVVQQGNVAVSKALIDIGTGFAALEDKLDDQTLGLFPCRLTISLNVRASAANGGSLVVGEEDRGQFGGDTESEASQENHVQVEMYNPACLPQGTVGYEKPTEVDELKSGMIITKTDLQDVVNPPVTN